MSRQGLSWLNSEEALVLFEVVEVFEILQCKAQRIGPEDAHMQLAVGKVSKITKRCEYIQPRSYTRPLS